MEDPIEIYESTPEPIRLDSLRRSFEASTAVGLRDAQEDRLILCPHFIREDAAFFGVFDGTVGDHASHFIQRNLIRYICANEAVKTSEIFKPEPVDTHTTDVYAEKIGVVLKEAFLKVDGALIEYCTENQLHYASSTGVTAFLWRNLLTVAHVGDSKACIARVLEDKIHPEWLTIDHKPDMPHELERIERSGGSLAWLHGNKPYIRGGDFHVRQVAGEHPKQLNYSRAFGGKDLKTFGLTAEPDVSHFEIMPEDKLVIIASDGLWDVLKPKLVCEMALSSHKSGRNATEDIVNAAILEMPSRGVRDNITVIAIFLNEEYPSEP